jgi:hypothetical protein
MADSPIWTVFVTAITVLGSASAWRYWERRAMKKEKDEDFMKSDCRDRISKLEALLAESSREKDEMRELILSLTEKVAALSVKVEYLQKENHDLQNRIVN